MSDLLGEARVLATGPRRILGITGPPGAGKSTLARALVALLGPCAVLVGMDGFHLLNEELVRLGRRNRKGAPDTFDARVYVVALNRLRSGSTVHAPDFDRVADAPVPDAITVPGSVPLVVTEGNYLLVDEGAWAGVRPLLDVCWYVDVEDSERLRRLVDRHHAYGRSVTDARAWATGSDQANADLVARTRGRADRVVTAAELDATLAAAGREDARRPEGTAGVC
ncbi:nucleoside/nucleotide kinase family protein [soil metagenome]